MSKYICQICGFVFDESKGVPDKGIAPGTLFEQLPSDWKCPLCGAPKSKFKKEETNTNPSSPSLSPKPKTTVNHSHSIREMSSGELAALCSNLARGCEKQYKAEESALFTQLAEYYTIKTTVVENKDFEALTEVLNDNFSNEFNIAKQSAEDFSDRGAKRVLTWSEKVSAITSSILERYQNEGNKILENTKIYVCDICGFIYIGDDLPSICPICKVPNFKILEVTRV